MASIAAVVREFFEACEAGRGWEACRAYCAPDVSFSAQTEPVADLRTLQQYAHCMKQLLHILPDGPIQKGLCSSRLDFSEEG